ncbi:hypothetical protein H4Q32_005853 [Labeo rohita]|uniref:CCHC-type domain-containing protein n=1 Tax=Labeo rohita TaxID=84645 RepID=A0ABQ8LQS5_LABRO|nr:hypothetical protein H4Q32_005853 [Labeo rohita]
MSSSGRKSLVWDIRKRLLTLSAGELLQVARAVEPVSNEVQSELVEGDEEGCYDYINSFMYSKQLLDTEDEGMVQLLILKDAIDEVVKCRDDEVSMSNVKGDSELHTEQGWGKLDDRVDFIEDSVITQTAPENTTDTHKQSHHTFNVARAVSPRDIAELDSGSIAPAMSNTPDTASTELLKVLASYEEISKKLIQCLPTHAVPPQTQLTQSSGLLQQPDRKPPSELASQSAREGMVSLRELSYLPRREFKVQGGQIEIVRGVLRIMKPGIFKEMLINKDDMTVTELKGFLQTHLREKNSTELFQELMCTKQDENETPQQFLYRVIGLKQRILLTSRLADTNIKYSTATVQDVFLHTVYQGFGHKHTDIRRELKPLLTNSGVTDEMILRHVMKITSEENERMKRLGSSRRQTVTNAHSAQLESDVEKTLSTKSESVESKSKQTKPDPLRELTTKVEELTRLVETMQKQNQHQLTHNGRQYSQNRTPSRRGKPYGCPSCVEQDRQDCKHCFTCGEEGHRAAGCLKRPKRQGNSIRALERDI